MHEGLARVWGLGRVEESGIGAQAQEIGIENFERPQDIPVASLP
jgi:hypothetical protein